MARPKKETVRDQFFKIRMSQKEKENFIKYAESININPSRLARNLLNIQTESIIGKYIDKPLAKTHIKIKELFKDKDFLAKMKED